MDPRRVLVADDNVSLADTVGEILNDHGFDVTVVTSGTEVLLAWRERPADVAVLDVDLPDIGGLRLARRLASRRHRCGLVLMSARDPEDLRPRVEAVGAEFLPKPFSPKHLLGTVEALVRHLRDAASRQGNSPLLLGAQVPRALLDRLRRRRR